MHTLINKTKNTHFIKQVVHFESLKHMVHSSV